jgi:hypothetical protein
MMRVARAFLWEYRRRHQLALGVLVVYLIAFLALQRFVLGLEYKVRLNPPNGFAFFVILPGLSMLFYMIGAFTYGLSGDLAARESIFPKRMLTLPITTHALVGWPMLVGSACAVLLWIVIANFLRIAGSDYPLPWIWPALLCAAYIAWMQALSWMPYGIAGVRVVAAVLWLFIVDAIVITAFEKQVPEPTMIAIIAPQLPIAYLLAWLGVARARRGVVPDWSAAWSVPPEVVRAIFRRRRAFRSAAAAQFWFEWRRSGRALPAMVAIVVPAELAILFIPNNNTRTPGIIVALFALLLPPVLAFFSATSFATPTSFVLSRPVSDATLIAAKLKSTLISTVMASLIVAIAIPAAEMWSGASVPVMNTVQPIIDTFEPDGVLVLVLFAVIALISWTWRLLVQNLCISLTGNPWLIKSTVLIGLTAMGVIGPGLQWLSRHRDAQAAVWNSLPLIAIALVSVKFVAGAVVMSRLHSSRTLADRALVAWAVAWFGAVVAIYGVLSWLFTDVMMPAYLRASIAVLMMPLAGVGAAPLALAWSRHR